MKPDWHTVFVTHTVWARVCVFVCVCERERERERERENGPSHSSFCLYVFSLGNIVFGLLPVLDQKY